MIVGMTKYGPIYADGPLRPDLTPLDLYAAGYFIREHRTPGKWCWWRKNPYDRAGQGQLFGKPCNTVDEAIADARWLMSGEKQTIQMTLAA